ncbi:hypothetical protein BC628DRAFT_1502229 [Trametes gibbosa]|nr:hypothetical protein BC628DRAFT_1502229 [Trametes gibbosa]
MSDSSYEQAIINDYPRLLVENYCIVASSALLWFDCAMTFPEEYRRIWKRQFSGATLVYIVMRYSAVIERIFFVLEVLVWNSTDKTFVSQCGRITHTDDALLFINYLSFAAFTTLRVYGVWGKDWRPLLLVLPLSLIKPLVIMAGTIAADGVVVILTWIKTFEIIKQARKARHKAPLATMLLRDGTAYFLILLVIQIITIVSNEIGNSLTIWLVWPYFDQVITVIFFSRFILDLRGLYFATDDQRAGEADTTLHLSDVKFEGFTSTIVGNFGATLNTTAAPVPIPVSVPAAGPGAALGTGEGTDSPASATGSDDSIDRAYACQWDAAWREDLPEYSDDPFRSGFSLASSSGPEKPPALVDSEEQMASPVEEEKAEPADGEGQEIQEIRLGDSPV